MSDKPTVVDLGFAVARLEPEQSCRNMGGGRWELTILAPDRIMETAKCIHVCDSGIRTLRDTLNSVIGREIPTPPAREGWTCIPDNDYFEIIRKAAAYDAAVEKAKANRDMEASWDTGKEHAWQLQMHLASGAFLKEKA